MKSPIFVRKQIPFFHNKTENEFRKDPYERYEEMVVRQMALHLTDVFWDQYPFRIIMDWIRSNLTLKEDQKIVEVGCGVGRLIGEIAKENTRLECWGIDYSYQMLRSAHHYWKVKKSMTIDCSAKGFSKIDIHGYAMDHLQFGLAKGEALPFENDSIDVVFSSFLLDRLDNPLKGLQEQFRILKSSGKMLLISPLNFQQATHWNLLHPTHRLIDVLETIGFSIATEVMELIVEEPLDFHGNVIRWKCVGVIGEKE